MTVNTVLDHTTDFVALTEANIETIDQEINAKLKLRNQHPPVPVYTVQVILPHGEHADLEKIYKYIVPGKDNIFTMSADQTEWTPRLNDAVTQASEISADFERVRVVYAPSE